MITDLFRYFVIVLAVLFFGLGLEPFTSSSSSYPAHH